ncbi:MAG: cupredoxin domain-containing protein [Actinomycetota bacterium]
MLRKLLTVALLGVAASGLSMPAADAATVNIEMQDNVFAPPESPIQAGDTVIWTNTGTAPHTATLKDVFDSSIVQPGDKYEFVADAALLPPEFEYVCTLHITQGMKAKMTVAGATGTLPEPEEEAAIGPSPTPKIEGNLAVQWWKRTENLPIGLRVFAPLALVLFLTLMGLAGLGYLKALKKARQA